MISCYFIGPKPSISLRGFIWNLAQRCLKSSRFIILLSFPFWASFIIVNEFIILFFSWLFTGAKNIARSHDPRCKSSYRLCWRRSGPEAQFNMRLFTLFIDLSWAVSRCEAMLFQEWWEVRIYRPIHKIRGEGSMQYELRFSSLSFGSTIEKGDIQSKLELILFSLRRRRRK